LHKSAARTPPAIPWVDLCNNPDRYYDQQTFKVPVSIKDPTDYLNDPADVFLLLKFFSNAAASGHPFRFWSFDSPARKATGMPILNSSSSSIPKDAMSADAVLSSNTGKTGMPILGSSSNPNDAAPSTGAASSSTDNVAKMTREPILGSSSIRTDAVSSASSPLPLKDVAPSPSDKAVGLAEKVTGMPVPRPLTLKNTTPSPTDNAVELVEEATGASVLTTKRSKKKPKKRATLTLTADAIEPAEEATGMPVVTTKLSKKKPKKHATTSALAPTALASTSSSLVPGSDEVSSRAVAPTSQTYFASVPGPGPNPGDIVAGPKRKQTEGEDQLEELGPRKRKPTKRARGLDYDDSTLSDKEKRTGITKQGHKRRST